MKTSQEDYQAALEFIYSYVDYSRTHQEGLSSENFDLSRMERYMELLGSPQNQYPTIHIAGSKGKGSVGAFCTSALQVGGYKVGFYTSPHLRDFEERMQINRVPIPRNVLAEYVAEVKPLVAAVPELTSFEIMTGLAYLYFSRSDVDLAVIEVGLGGRLDATNVITPMVSVITSLYLDHISYLGDTLEQIAWEKGGIIKPGVPVVCAPQQAGPLEVLQSIARKNGSHFIDISQKYRYQIQSKSLESQVFSLTDIEDSREIKLQIPLIGDFQVVNAATAFGVLETIRSEGISLTQSAIEDGFRSVKWPARFEVLRKQPPVVVDSAHNPGSVQILRKTIDDYFPDIPLILVFGVSEDKQVADMLKVILPRTEHLIVTQANHPRAMDTDQLEIVARGSDCPTESISDVAQAMRRALSLAGDSKLVVAAGSIFVAASARIAWYEKNLGEQINQ